MSKRSEYKIGVIGYGVFGSKFISWLKDTAPEVEILYVVEINRHKRDILKKLGYSTYESIYDVPPDLLSQTLVIVDCSTRGQGLINKLHYQKLGLKAIFQNGEEDSSIGDLYYPGLSQEDKISQFVKVPLCSGIASIKVMHAIKQNDLANIKRVEGYHMKVTNTAKMLTMDYTQSNSEIKKLLNVDARMNVIYMRGEPYNGLFAYHGAISVEVDKNIDKGSLLVALNNTELIRCESQEIDTMFYSGGTDTIVIEDSIYCENNVLRLSTMSFTPEINFPINLQAIYAHGRSW